LQYGYEFHFKDDSEAMRSALFSEPTGSQLHHLLRYLHQASLSHSAQSKNQTEECVLSSPESAECLPSLSLSKTDQQLFAALFERYQFAYQPAMSMYERYVSLIQAVVMT
jgi:hypothetical protein